MQVRFVLFPEGSFDLQLLDDGKWTSLGPLHELPLSAKEASTIGDAILAQADLFRTVKNTMRLLCEAGWSFEFPLAVSKKVVAPPLKPEAVPPRL